MDDNQTYLLNGLIARHFALGRIVRFRPVQRGRQTESFELFTAQEKEYLVQLFPPDFHADALEFAAGAVNLLDAQRFSVMPFVASKDVVFVAPGPQGRHMTVSLAPAGSALPAADYTHHDISQVGLRLAWMHRLLKENLPPTAPPPAHLESLVPATGPLRDLLRLSLIQGWVHGDFQPAALLHDADHQLRAVTDWGLLHWGCPLEDLVDAFLALCIDHRGNPLPARGTALLEAYDSLLPIRRMPWSPVVAWWCRQRLYDSTRRPTPADFLASIVAAPERLATAIASCL